MAYSHVLPRHSRFRDAGGRVRAIRDGRLLNVFRTLPDDSEDGRAAGVAGDEVDREDRYGVEPLAGGICEWKEESFAKRVWKLVEFQDKVSGAEDRLGKEFRCFLFASGPNSFLLQVRRIHRKTLTDH